jgi:hypothetical protein
MVSLDQFKKVGYPNKNNVGAKWLPCTLEKRAFSTGQELWQFTVELFLTYNAALFFEQPMAFVLRILTYEACAAYMDDTTVVHRRSRSSLDNPRKKFQEGSALN